MLNKILNSFISINFITNLIAGRKNRFEKIFYFKKKLVSTKWSNYFEVYEKYFHKFRNKKMNILEIGVADGGSLLMWKKYFGNKASVFGLDIDPRCNNLNNFGCKVFIGSQDDVEFLNYVKDNIPKLDIIIDDGGHTMSNQIVSFKQLFPHLREGGVYVCEDTHTSYWNEYGGGLKKEGTFIEYVKELIDGLHSNHINCENKNFNIVNDLKSISFYDSIVVFEKGAIIKPEVVTSPKYYYFNYMLGKYGILIKSKTPFIYKILKPYFPDKK